jgi:hypothetical protein
MSEYEIENQIHFFACSNSVQAIKLDDSDRRWLVPRVTEEKREHEYWRELHTWLSGDGIASSSGGQRNG